MILKPANNPMLAAGAAICAGLMTIAFIITTRAADRRALAYQLAAARNPVPVVVALRNIAPGALINQEDVGYKEMPQAYVAAGFIGRKARVIGREAVSEIFAGEVVLAARVTGAMSRRAASVIKVGRVALAVGTDEIAGVAGGVRAGDRVEVFVTDEENGRTALFLNDARVLGIGGIYPFSPREPAVHGDDVPSQTTVAGTTVVLELTPAQAGKLTQATETGKVRLALKGAGYRRGR